MSASAPIEGFFRLDKEWSRLDTARVAILPLPYEHTTSYGKGAALAPAAIRDASSYLELYDEELDTEIFMLSNGIATLPPLCFDASCRDAAAVEAIREQVSRLIDQDKFVICIGGEHTISIGSALAYTHACPNLSILQLDAHSDLRSVYEGNPYSHACVMARIYEFNRNIVQVGIRSQGAEEAEFIKKNRIATFYAHDIRQGRYGSDMESWQHAVIETLQENVYVTFDCDFLDPALMPALGTPEPGGFGWDETISFLRTLAARRTIVGFDVNEFAPVPPFIHPQFTIAKLIYKLIGYIFS
ncbi:MAG: agmatinase [Alphaproteobacteria bacterium]|uniref:Agmatinase n=1 Tax=Candidatus Nitrobium versatile TaxID=2884831 RepID=A0A953SHU5_9BACT|nr:agmatinase [Candidatus Nitrobium versatile]